MSKLKHDQVIVELWPSHLEHPSNAGISKHKPFLAEFHGSIDSLLQELESLNLQVEPYTDTYLHKGEPVARACPPLIVELAAWLGSSGIALALFKALKLWVELKNGRRFKVVDGNLEVEATQLTQDQFVELFEILRKNRETQSDTNKLMETLKQRDLNPAPFDPQKRMEEFNLLCGNTKVIYRTTDD